MLVYNSDGVLIDLSNRVRGYWEYLIQNLFKHHLAAYFFDKMIRHVRSLNHMLSQMICKCNYEFYVSLDVPVTVTLIARDPTVSTASMTTTDSVTMATMTGVTDMLAGVRVKVFVEPPPVARITLSLTPAMTLPAPEVTLGVTSMTGPDGGSMRDLHLLDVCVEHAVRQTVDLPRWGRDAVLWAVHGAPTVRHVLKPGLPGLRKRLQSVVEGRQTVMMRDLHFLCWFAAIATVFCHVI